MASVQVLVTGATGFVGREVLRQLEVAGHHARVLVRNTKTAADRLPQPTCVTEFHHGDVTDVRSLSGAAKGCDAVIHLVGIISEFGDVTFRKLHVEATRNLTTVAQAESVKRFMHMSALGTRPNAPAHYHQTKWEAEEIVRQSGLEYTIFQPSVIYGPEDHFVNLFAQMASRLPFMPVIGSGKPLLQPVAVDVVAQCFVQALIRSESIGHTFELCGPERLSMVELIKTLMKVVGQDRRTLHIPMAVARFQAMVLEVIFASILGKQPPFTRDQLLMIQEDNVGDPSAIEQMFGVCQTRFEDGIKKYVNRP